MRSTFYAPAALVLAACGGAHRTLALSQLQDSALSIFVPADHSQARVWVQDHAHTIGLGCLVLEPNVAATLGGATPTASDLGGFVPAAATDAAAGCSGPEFTFDLPAAGLADSTDITITDGSTTLGATVSNLTAQRQLTLTSAVHPGSEITFQWSVSSDALDAAPGVGWTADAGTGFTVGAAFGKPGTTWITGDTVHAQLPADAGLGAGSFIFTDLATPTFTACTGITTCSANAIQPPPVFAEITAL